MEKESEMTEYSNGPRSNGLGGRKYEPWEEQTIHRLALFLRGRDTSLNFFGGPLGEPRPRPKDYILLYVKAAGVAFETAKALSCIAPPRHMKEKSIEEWLSILTGMPYISRDDVEIYHRHDAVGDGGPNTNGDVFRATMETLPVLTASIEVELTCAADQPTVDSPETKAEDPC